MIQNASVVLLSYVDPYWVPGTCSEYFRSSSQELNRHLVSARKMAGPQKAMQELDLQAAQNQRGTEGHIREAPLLLGKHSLGEHLVGSSEGLGTEQASAEGMRGCSRSPAEASVCPTTVDKCSQKLYKTVCGILCLRRYREAVGG